MATTAQERGNAFLHNVFGPEGFLLEVILCCFAPARTGHARLPLPYFAETLGLSIRVAHEFLLSCHETSKRWFDLPLFVERHDGCLIDGLGDFTGTSELAA